MNLELDEIERDFLLRVCSRAESFSKLHIMNPKKLHSEFERNTKAIEKLIQKIKELKEDE